MGHHHTCLALTLTLIGGPSDDGILPYLVILEHNTSMQDQGNAHDTTAMSPIRVMHVADE